MMLYNFWTDKLGKRTAMVDIIEECMKVTSFGGQAKSLALQAIGQARGGSIDEADKTMAEAGDYLRKSHEAHTSLLSSDAENEGAEMRVTLFMVHAADHLASADTLYLLAEEIIHLYRKEEK